MSAHNDEIGMPKGALLAAASVVLFALAIATTARLTGIGVSKTPEAPVAQSRELRFSETEDGRLLVFEPGGTSPVGVLGRDHHGFVRVVLKGLARERMLHETDRGSPVRLVSLTDGRRLVEDPTTGRSINLRAFGAGNAEAFTMLFDMGRKP